MKVVRNLDKIAKIILVVGAAGSHVTKDTGKRNRRLQLGIYALVGAASAYELVRTLGPKTAEERRAEQVNDLYEKANYCAKQADRYRQAAQTFINDRYKELKSEATS